MKMTAERRAALVEKMAMAIAKAEKYNWYNKEIYSFRDSFRRNASAALDVVIKEAL